MPEPTIEQLAARERAEAWLAAGKRHAERGYDERALGCFTVAHNLFAEGAEHWASSRCAACEASEQPLRRLAGTLPEEGTSR